MEAAINHVPLPDAISSVVKSFEDMLSDAKSGEVMAFVFGALNRDGLATVRSGVLGVDPEILALLCQAVMSEVHKTVVTERKKLLQ